VTAIFANFSLGSWNSSHSESSQFFISVSVSILLTVHFRPCDAVPIARLTGGGLNKDFRGSFSAYKRVRDFIINNFNFIGAFKWREDKHSQEGLAPCLCPLSSVLKSRPQWSYRTSAPVVLRSTSVRNASRSIRNLKAPIKLKLLIIKSRTLL
jgi:hypothetical protein